MPDVETAMFERPGSRAEVEKTISVLQRLRALAEQRRDDADQCVQHFTSRIARWQRALAADPAEEWRICDACDSPVGSLPHTCAEACT